MDPLAQLNDIVQPTAPGWWPPALGWWALALFIIVATVLLVMFELRHRRERKLQLGPRRQLHAAWQAFEQQWQANQESNDFARQCSIFLRRAAVLMYPERDVAGLIGEEWLRFLDQTSNSDQFTNGPGKVLLIAPYSRTSARAPHFDAAELRKTLQHWVEYQQ